MLHAVLVITAFTSGIRLNCTAKYYKQWDYTAIMIRRQKGNLGHAGYSYSTC